MKKIQGIHEKSGGYFDVVFEDGSLEAWVTAERVKQLKAERNALRPRLEDIADAMVSMLVRSVETGELASDDDAVAFLNDVQDDMIARMNDYADDCDEDEFDEYFGL